MTNNRESDAGRLYRTPLRGLPADPLARRDAELLPAAPLRAGPGPCQAVAAGRARRVRAGRHRGDDARVRAPLRPRPAAVAPVPDLSARRDAARLQLFDRQLPED